MGFDFCCLFAIFFPNNSSATSVTPENAAKQFGQKHFVDGGTLPDYHSEGVKKMSEFTLLRD